MLAAFALLSLLFVRAGPLTPYKGMKIAYAEETAVLPLLRHPSDHRRLYALVEDPWLGRRVFFIDTGYSVTTCDDDFVADIDGRVRRTLTWSVGEVGMVRLGKATIPALTLGGHRLEKVPCAVRDLATTSSIPDLRRLPVAGVLGSDILFRFRTEIDPEAGEIRLSRPSHGEPPPADGSVRMRREHPFSSRRVVELELNDGRMHCILDTGATGTQVDARRADLRLVQTRSVVVMGTGRTNRKKVVQSVYEAEARFAGKDLGTVRVVHRSRPPWGRGLIGMDVLGRFALILDPAQRLLYVREIADWHLEKPPRIP